MKKIVPGRGTQQNWFVSKGKGGSRKWQLGCAGHIYSPISPATLQGLPCEPFAPPGWGSGQRREVLQLMETCVFKDNFRSWAGTQPLT